MTMDSKIITFMPVETTRTPYLTSDPLENNWGGQLPISRQVFQIGLTALIDGIYVSAQPKDPILSIEPGLANEFSAWEAASEEDFQRFETGLN